MQCFYLLLIFLTILLTIYLTNYLTLHKVGQRGKKEYIAFNSGNEALQLFLDVDFSIMIEQSVVEGYNCSC